MLKKLYQKMLRMGHLVGSVVEHVTLHLRVVSLSPTLGMEINEKIKNLLEKKEMAREAIFILVFQITSWLPVTLKQRLIFPI